MHVVRVTPDLAKAVRFSKKQTGSGYSLDLKIQEKKKIVKIFNGNVILNEYETDTNGHNWM